MAATADYLLQVLELKFFVVGECIDQLLLDLGQVVVNDLLGFS